MEGDKMINSKKKLLKRLYLDFKNISTTSSIFEVKPLKPKHIRKLNRFFRKNSKISKIKNKGFKNTNDYVVNCFKIEFEDIYNHSVIGKKIHYNLPGLTQYGILSVEDWMVTKIVYYR